MNRCGFLGLLAGAAVDPERLLWVPGRKLISIPAPSIYLSLDEFSDLYLRPAILKMLRDLEDPYVGVFLES